MYNSMVTLAKKNYNVDNKQRKLESAQYFLTRFQFIWNSGNTTCMNIVVKTFKTALFWLYFDALKIHS